jgi:hypothetical protein
MFAKLSKIAKTLKAVFVLVAIVALFALFATNVVAQPNNAQASAASSFSSRVTRSSN